MLSKQIYNADSCSQNICQSAKVRVFTNLYSGEKIIDENQQRWLGQTRFLIMQYHHSHSPTIYLSQQLT
jgi:hypothetical protein